VAGFTGGGELSFIRIPYSQGLENNSIVLEQDIVTIKNL
jgi:hypothetical protein